MRTLVPASTNGWPPHRIIEGENAVINSLDAFPRLQKVVVNVDLQIIRACAGSAVNPDIELGEIVTRGKVDGG